jgi:hypothetical protein
VLDDGDYDAFIVWAESRDGVLVLDCTITTGPHKGDVLEIAASEKNLADPLDLVGIPCSITVAGGVMRVRT